MPSSQNMDEILLRFTEEYKKTIPEKLRALRNILDDMHRRITPENLQELRSHIHKITGSAGTYGFGSVSHICRQFESDLLEKSEILKEAAGDPAWLHAFEANFKKIKEAFTAK